MTDQNPYEPVPLDIPPGHPLLDAGGFTDLRALGEVGPSGADLRANFGTGPSAEQLAAALKTLAAAGISVDSLSSPDNIRVALSPGSYSGPDLPPGLAELLNAASANLPPRRGRPQPGPRCHRCNTTPTHQWIRRASDQEAEDWHAGREQHIRAHNDGRPAAEYVADRSDTVTMAVHGCDAHNLAPAPEPIDGTEEAERAAKEAAEQAGAALRTLMHDADCGGHGACECGDDCG